MPALAFDLGGTHLRCGVAEGGRIVSVTVKKVANFLEGLSPDEVATGVADQIIHFEQTAEDTIGRDDPIVLAFPGPIVDRRVALSAPTLYGQTAHGMPDLAGELARRTGRSVHLINDVSAAAWELSRTSAASRFMVVTVSSGIGSKVFDRENRQGVFDDPPYCGEIGHFVVDSAAEAPICDCGARGHLGAISSGRGVERLARQTELNAALDNYADVVPAIWRREEWAIGALTASIAPLARTLLAVTMAIGLERIYIMGGFAQSVGPLYAELLNKSLLKHSNYPVVEPTLAGLAEVVGIDEHLGLRGAAYYASSLDSTAR